MARLFFSDIGFDRPIDPSEPEFVAWCDDCGNGLLEGERMFEGNRHNWLCEECFMDEIKNLEPVELAFALGRDVRNVGERY